MRGLYGGCRPGACSFLHLPGAGGGGHRRQNRGRAWPDGTEKLSTLQKAFVDRAAVQCGFCTPVFLMTLTALLESNAPTSDSDIDEAIVGNICRCTGYSAIRAAVRSVVREGGS